MQKVNEMIENPCAIATTRQGLDSVLALKDWRIEQTGGYTMVAYRYFSDGTALGVTKDGETELGEDLYLISYCHGVRADDYPGYDDKDYIVAENQTIHQVKHIGLAYSRNRYI